MSAFLQRSEHVAVGELLGREEHEVGPVTAGEVAEDLLPLAARLG